MKQKRGQVTVFIIIGIIVLIVAFSAIFLRDYISTTISDFLHPETKSVRLYVEDCIDTTGNTAVELAAAQGGYIQIPARLEATIDGYIPPPPTPIKIPMWWYNGRSYVPTLDEIEEQISIFVANNIEQCIDDFSSFKQFEISKTGEIEVRTQINRNDVDITVDYPIEITTAEDVIEMDRFRNTIDKKLGKLYELASSIMEYENEESFLEQITIDVIAVADGAKDSPLFPLEGYALDCGKNKWSIQFELIPLLQEMVKYNFNYITYKGTDFVDPGYEYFRDQYSFDVSSRNYPDIQVRTIYDKSFGMEMDVEPSTGDTVTAFPIKAPLIDIISRCFKIFHHRYDIEYPVQFQLEDLEGGLIFNFATPVVIEKNEPKRTVSPFAFAFDYSPTNEDFCENRIYPREIFVKDKVSGEFLRGVDIRYQCTKFGCDLGATEVPSYLGVPIAGASPVLSTAFPPCYNGLVIATKSGYMDDISQLTVEQAGVTPPPIELTPLRELNISVRILELTDSSINIRSMEESESLIIYLESQELEYESSYLHPPNQYSGQGLKFIYDDNRYIIDAKLIRDESPIGGLYLDKWLVTRGELSTSNELLINIITKPVPPQNIDDFALMWAEQVIPKSDEYPPVIR